MGLDKGGGNIQASTNPLAGGNTPIRNSKRPCYPPFKKVKPRGEEEGGSKA